MYIYIDKVTVSSLWSSNRFRHMAEKPQLSKAIWSFPTFHGYLLHLSIIVSKCSIQCLFRNSKYEVGASNILKKKCYFKLAKFSQGASIGNFGIGNIEEMKYAKDLLFKFGDLGILKFFLVIESLQVLSKDFRLAGNMPSIQCIPLEICEPNLVILH